MECSECNCKYTGEFVLNHRELKDGYHGLCPKCGQMNYSPKTEILSMSDMPKGALLHRKKEIKPCG